MREKLKQEIRANVNIVDTSKFNYVSVLKYSDYAVGNNWTKAIQKALDENKSVYIPDMNGEIMINRPIIMDSGYNLKVEIGQVIKLEPKANTCMIRNKNIVAGDHQYVEQINPDEYITVCGGTWTTPESERCMCDKLGSIQGSWGVIEFSNVNHINITDITVIESYSYAVHIGNCHDFYVNNISFYNHNKDGIHLNGPSAWGIVSNLKGKDMGDDMIAFNAWDWYRAAITFGSIEKVLVENVESDNNEFRLLTGRKQYGNNTTYDCAIRDCVFENMSGIYTYKLYYQPNCVNVMHGYNFDGCDYVGEMSNIYFKDIDFPKLRESGFNSIPIYGLFDVLSNCTNMNFENISVAHSVEELDKMGIKLVSVGPISATFQRTENKQEWGDFFDPDSVCHAEDLKFKNITFNGKDEKNKDNIIKEVHQTINKDYPNTLPAGGTGYGTIADITVE